MTGNLLFIGNGQQQPIYHNADLKNFTEFKTALCVLLSDLPLPSVAVVLDE
jgi:hypothetical protein